MHNIGDKVRIVVDNYKEYQEKVLVITDIYNSVEEHPGYDDTMEGSNLYDLVCEDGEDFPYSLYDYEIE